MTHNTGRSSNRRGEIAYRGRVACINKLLVLAVLGGLNVAVTPLCRPEIDKLS